jgi:hypothetical protein
LEFFELLAGAVVFTQQAGFVARQFAEGVPAVGVSHVRPGALGGLALRCGERLRSFIDGKAQVEDGCFEGHNAVVSNAGFGQALDQKVFVGVLRVVFFAELFEQVEQSFGIFVGEHAGFGGEAVLESVAARLGFAFRSFRSGGFLRVSAICIDLSFSGHESFSDSKLFAGPGAGAGTMAGRC